MGPLPKGRSGVSFLVVFVDAFSKLVSLYAIKSATAKATFRCLNKYIERVAKPKAILTDNGSQFTSGLWETTLIDLDIKMIHTSVYYSQGNTTERVNREIGRILRSYCFSQHTRWANMLNSVENWLNNVYHESTGFIPAVLHLGKKRESPYHRF